MAEEQNFLDENGVLYFWSKVKALFNQGIKGLSINGTTLTYTKGDGTTGTITIPQKVYDAFTGATASAAGKVGLVPAPAAGNQNKYLRGDGTWQTPPDTNTTYAAFKGATAAAAGGTGLVPAPTANQNNRFLIGNGNWEKLIIDIVEAVSGGKVITLSTDSNTNFDEITIPLFGSSASGLVPKGDGDDSHTLYADGTWGAAVDSFGITEVSNGYRVGMMINNGTEYVQGVIPYASSDTNGIIPKSMYAKLDSLPSATVLESTYAKKSELSGLYKYKGSVATESALPTSGRTAGDTYNIVAASSYGGAGTNVSWVGDDSAGHWDALGGTFTINAISNATLDQICV